MKGSTITSRKKHASVKNVVRKIVCLLLWLMIWWLTALLIREELLLPAPGTVLKTLFQLAAGTAFWRAVGGSLLHVAAGFLLALLLGCILAWLTHASKFAYDFFYPMLSTVKATPVASFIILALFWLPTSQIPVLTSFLMVLPAVWTNLYTGLAHLDADLLEMGKAYRYTRTMTLRYLYFPSVLPYLQAACLAGLGMAWKAGVAAEVIGRVRDSIGLYLIEAKLYLNMPDMFAWTIVTIFISVALEKAVAFLMGRLNRRWGYV